jgi:hypothetical protein
LKQLQMLRLQTTSDIRTTPSQKLHSKSVPDVHTKPALGENDSNENLADIARCC